MEQKLTGPGWRDRQLSFTLSPPRPCWFHRWSTASTLPENYTASVISLTQISSGTISCAYDKTENHQNQKLRSLLVLSDLAERNNSGTEAVGLLHAAGALWEYYNLNMVRSRSGRAVDFTARARILDRRRAIYNGQAPLVASYSSRGPDVNNALLRTADVMKPNIMTPGSSILAAWSPNSKGDEFRKGKHRKLVGNCFWKLFPGKLSENPPGKNLHYCLEQAGPLHTAGIAALIKQKYPQWSPSTITSAMMTTAELIDESGAPILAQNINQLAPATPFDFGAGFINPYRAIDPGPAFNTDFNHYVRKPWCSDLNTASVAVSNLVGLRNVTRRVTNVGHDDKKYRVVVREAFGVKVGVFPKVLEIRLNASRQPRLVLEATKAYTFGGSGVTGK
ncbi:PA-domain containing subtilase family protein [Actinidia rufa]|uniref:PA-domain containing subtilase family protein n=1 Tax=Actinidia rufa TaxID=165716 RepID=A0A7J0FQU3_9ERIC|nr:PA-domain containing subtilase family protein [Actinidia rufa]